MQKLFSRIWIYLIFLPLLSLNSQNISVEQWIENKVQPQEEDIVAVDGIELFSQVELPRFYSNRAFKPAWRDAKNRNDLIESLKASFDEGLMPKDYHLERIEGLIMKSDHSSLSREEMADLDLLMTDALIIYASHLLDGKLDQSEIRKKWDVERNEGPSNPDSLLTATLHNRNIKTVLEDLKPKHYMYKLMKFHLKKLRNEAETGGWPMVSEGETLKPGDTSSRIPEIRKYLTAVGDLKDLESENSEVFDEELEEAVKKFQWRHRLTSDGIIGKGTIEQMQVPIEKRIENLILNLERTRWILQEFDEDFLIVNIAGFHVKRITNKKEVFDSRVIVGKYHKETPVFKGVMKYIVMNPTWTLPYSIATHETLPRLKKDPGYLSAKHMEVMDRNGKVIDHSSIDWSQYSAGNFPFIIRQKAGPWNALGEVKFMFPNKYAVYLHDTPSRGLFNQQDRAFSHGCIRTEDKWGLLMSLMDDPEVWNMDKINEILKSGETTTITLPEPINIYLIYLTAAVDQDNNLMFMKDVYKRDKDIAKAMKKPFHFEKAN
ncbi:L,D-transpeptidase family protein [Lutimonas saemankumensis]|uniref:L,D-transpeptidase family protein n=1 Tax=Lutimonas saemankumensis TaxID=483016 RepID=UPI001CD818CF|nr:L,D-transpeptidase family protein [Lutimonas saemankumensis]MCA0933765.1 L,D-transpeptidase family protein [Lutimonas saemankumensis]